MTSTADGAIVVVDNRDSFVFNLSRYLTRLAVELPVEVVPAHDTTVEAIGSRQPRAIVISPGPCTPVEAGVSLELVRWAAGRVPLLGVCLGHQAIAAAAGGRIVRAATPRHGRASPVHHDGSGVFRGLPSPFAGCRYHSLVVEEATLPPGLMVTARDDEGTVMAIADRAGLAHGVQFHPEAILSEHGYQLLANFLNLAGIGCRPAATLASGERLAVANPPELPQVVTF
jgi:anthranilate synthase component 2